MRIMDKIKSITNRKTVRTLVVKSAINLTPNMRRVTLHGDELTGFPEQSEGAYIKLLFNQDGSEKPVMRTYTVALQRSEANEIDVDFVLHASDDSSGDGIAGPWSMSAKPGDEIAISGPGPAKFINTQAQGFILAADMTALPALMANLKRLPVEAVGQVFIEVLSEEDKQDLEKPAKVEIHWIINGHPGSDQTPLFHALQQAALPTGTLSAWVACEFKTMKKIRLHLKNDRGVEKSHLYISSYWKRGDTEEQHKVAKQADAKLAID